MKRKVFENPYIGYDRADGIFEELGRKVDFDVLVGGYGNPIIAIAVKNIVAQYSADRELYLRYHGVLQNMAAIMGEGHIVQKLDILDKKRYHAEKHDEYLQQKYSEHFEGRVFKTIDTFFAFTHIVDSSKKGKKAYRPTAAAYKDLMDRTEKVFMLLEQNGFAPRFLREADFERLLYGQLAMDFAGGCKYMENMKSFDGHMAIGTKIVKTVPFVDVENIELPNSIRPYTTMGGNGAVRNMAVDNFSFLNELEKYSSIVYSQVVRIPDQADRVKFLQNKRNKHEGFQNEPHNRLCAEEISVLLDSMAKDGQLVVDAQFMLVLCAETMEDMEQTMSLVDNSLFQKGIVTSRNAYNQFELFRTSLLGNATELKDYDYFTTTSEASLCFFFKESYPVNEESSFYLRFTDRQGVPLKVDTSDLPYLTNRINNRNKFVLGPSGSGKSFLMNNIVEQYLTYNYDVVIVDTGDSYSGLCAYIGGRYVQYTEEKPITMNPFSMDETEFNIEKLEFLVNLIFLIWQGADGIMSTTQKSILDNLLRSYYHQFFQREKEWHEAKNNADLVMFLAKFNITEGDIDAELKKGHAETGEMPRINTEEWKTAYREAIVRKIKEVERRFEVRELSFNSFYEFAERFLPIYLHSAKFDITEAEFNTTTFLMVLADFYKGGIYATTLNESADQSLFTEKFIVFEIDNVKDNPKLFPIVTLIIMDTFIQKMRLRKDQRKALIIEEAWKAIASKLMGGYILYLYKTVRKFWGEAVVVTQELDDIIGNAVVKDSIINNSDTFILLDQTKFIDNFGKIASLLSLNEVEQAKIFTINNLNNKFNRSRFKEFYIKRGATGEVYGNEVALQQYLTYTTEKPEKTAINYYVDELGSFQGALDRFVADIGLIEGGLPVLIALTNLYQKPMDEQVAEFYRRSKASMPGRDVLKEIKKKLEREKTTLRELVKNQNNTP